MSIRYFYEFNKKKPEIKDKTNNIISKIHYDNNKKFMNETLKFLDKITHNK